jgi:hypothetical protein
MERHLLHLVFGGEVVDPQGTEFVDTNALDIVGIFPDYDEALKAWRAASQRNVDQAHIKYVIVHLHRLLEPTEFRQDKA